MSVHISELKKYKESGWSWTINNDVSYRTDKYGEGLWVVNPSDLDKQCLGTCQFSLGSTYDGAYSKIRRYFSEVCYE